MVRHGTVRYGSVLGGFPLGTVPGNCFVPPRLGFQAIRTVTKCDVYTLLITDWPERIVITASLNLRHETHRPARFKSAQPAKERTHLFVSTTK